MPIATVSSKGQITLPAESRRALGIKPHDRVQIELDGDNILVRRAPDFFELKGFLGKALPPDQERKRMAEAVAKHVMERE